MKESDLYPVMIKEDTDDSELAGHTGKGAEPEFFRSPCERLKT